MANREKRHVLHRAIKELATKVQVPKYDYRESKRSDLERILVRAQGVYDAIINSTKPQSFKKFETKQIRNLIADKAEAFNIKRKNFNNLDKVSLIKTFNDLTKIQTTRAKAEQRKLGLPSRKKDSPDFDLETVELQGFKPSRKFKIDKISEIKAKRLANAVESKYKIELEDDDVERDFMLFIEIIRGAINNHIKENGLTDNDNIGVNIQNPVTGFWARSGMYKVKVGKTDEFINRVLKSLSGILEYDGSIDIQDITISVKSLKQPAGGTSKKFRVVNVEEDVKSKMSVFRINNSDNLCLARCLVIATNKDHPKLQQIKMGRKIQTDLAQELQQIVGITNPLCTLEDVQLFQDYLKCNIIVMNISNDVIFANITYQRERDIYVFYHDEHYDLITKVGAFIGKNVWCEKCLKGFKKHVNCPMDEEKKEEEWVNCKSCNRNFAHGSTYQEHLKKCGETIKCNKCNHVYDNKKLLKLGMEHICGHDFCKNCMKYEDVYKHKCYIQKVDLKPKIENVMYVDFETMQETGTHVVNLAVVYKSKLTDYDRENCHIEKRGESEFIVFKCIDSFCKYVFSKRHMKHTIVAHNGKGYDFQFIRKWLVCNGIAPYVINVGSKITFMELNVYKIRFVDSLNFLQMALKAFPETFDLKELRKGYFPHYFNKQCHQNYIGKMPAKQHYGYNYMSTKDKKKFEDWYVKHENDTFDLQKDILEY
ncbi:MAG: hypothetical protein RL675_1135, partial [Bacteroidota bacterium]